MAYTLEQILAALGKVENGGIMVADLQSLISSTRNEAAAMKMVTGLFSGQGHTWREAVAANGKGREMYTALRKELQETAGTRLRTLVDDTTYRIVTLPSDMGHEVSDHDVDQHDETEGGTLRNELVHLATGGRRCRCYPESIVDLDQVDQYHGRGHREGRRHHPGFQRGHG